MAMNKSNYDYEEIIEHFGKEKIMSRFNTLEEYLNIFMQKGRKKMAALHLTKENFKEEVLESDVPVLVDFWATWCGPCQMVGPIIEEIAGEVTDAKICKVDVDENPELAKEYRVMSIPTLMVFKNGEAVKREVGAKPKDEILDMLK